MKTIQFYSAFNQINAALLSIKESFQKYHTHSKQSVWTIVNV